LPSSPTSAARMLSLVTPPEVSRSFMPPSSQAGALPLPSSG
jgi:hypothetical protein